MDILKPRWTSATFLIYLGVVVVLAAVLRALGLLEGEVFGDASASVWALVAVVLLTGAAVAFERVRRPLIAGLFGVAAIVAVAYLMDALFAWGGRDADIGPGGGLNWDGDLVALAVIVASAAVLRRWRTSLATLPLVLAIYLLVVDVLSDGGDWGAVLTIFLGLVLLLVGAGLDAGGGHPYAFWIQVGAGLMVGGGLLYFWNDGDVDWALMGVLGIAYFGLARALGRSSWAVLGAVWLFLSATHFADRLDGDGGTTLGPIDFFFGGNPPYGFPNGEMEWVPPLVYGTYGAILIGLAYVFSERSSPAEGGPEGAGVREPQPPAPESPKAAAATAAEPEA